ncbi:MAG: superoxide dismutase [Deltaproteobacteria bacterium]|nr:superoxide dismutase [Deltaproteobacteria bacterium]
MKYELPPLPFKYSALKPHMSEETLKFHHDKHHQAYVDKLNKLLTKEKEILAVDELVRHYSPGDPIFNNAAQTWNHEFFWHCLTPVKEAEKISQSLKKVLASNFGSFEKFKEEFTKTATEGFASGWTWLEKKEDESLEIKWRPNAETPIQTQGPIPLLVCDLWEHAYYIDYRNVRKTYLESFWKLVNWRFVEECLISDEHAQFEFRTRVLSQKAG